MRLPIATGDNACQCISSHTRVRMPRLTIMLKNYRHNTFAFKSSRVNRWCCIGYSSWHWECTV